MGCYTAYNFLRLTTQTTCKTVPVKLVFPLKISYKIKQWNRMKEKRPNKNPSSTALNPLTLSVLSSPSSRFPFSKIRKPEEAMGRTKLKTHSVKHLPSNHQTIFTCHNLSYLTPSTTKTRRLPFFFSLNRTSPRHPNLHKLNHSTPLREHAFTKPPATHKRKNKKNHSSLHKTTQQNHKPLPTNSILTQRPAPINGLSWSHKSKPTYVPS